jgi:hypothetical protein
MKYIKYQTYPVPAPSPSHPLLAGISHPDSSQVPYSQPDLWTVEPRIANP